MNQPTIVLKLSLQHFIFYIGRQVKSLLISLVMRKLTPSPAPTAGKDLF